MLHRKIIGFGIPLLVGYFLIPIAFFLLSKYLFSKTQFAGYLYVLIALSLMVKLSAPKRNDFLRSVFSARDYPGLRMIENFLCSIPFLAFLMYKGHFLFVLGLGILTIFLAFFNFRSTLNFTIPTPFGKEPFEFTVGFRKTFYLFPVAYFLTFMSISVGNLNLGVFSLIAVGLICISYYSKPENEYFVWNFNLSSKDFLWRKIKFSSIYFTLLSLPIVIAISIYFFEDILILMGVLLLCYIYLATVVLAKYSAYPGEMNLPQVILIVISLVFPPIIPGVIAFFYSQSVKILNPLLNDPD